MTDFPDIRRATQWGDTHARKWQNLMREVSAVAGMQVGDGLEFLKINEVMHLTLAPRITQRQPRTRTVVLVEPVDPASMVLTVREIRYRDTPPVFTHPPVEPGVPSPVLPSTHIAYTWHEDVFQAFPEYGYHPLDYEPFLWREQVDVGTPQEPQLVLEEPQIGETVFLRARYEHGLWIAEMYPGAVRPEKFVIPKAYGANPATGDPDPDSQFIMVVEIKLSFDEQGNWTGGFEEVRTDPQVPATPVQVNVWPGLLARDYEPFKWEANDLTLPGETNTVATPLPLAFIRGHWWLKQREKAAVSLRRGPLRVVDCQPVEAT